MKRLTMVAGLCFSSTMLFALGCGNLGISITNTSASNCELKSTYMIYGYYLGGVPQTIPAGTSSPIFYIQQDNVGAGIQLDYRCDGKVAIFYSGQNHCGIFGAGDIGGTPYLGNDITMTFQKTLGSYWYGLPGNITWSIN